MKTTFTKLIKIHHLAAIAIACGCAGVNAEENEPFDEPYIINNGLEKPEPIILYNSKQDSINNQGLNIPEKDIKYNAPILDGGTVLAPSDNAPTPIEQTTTSQPLIQLDNRANRETFDSVKLHKPQPNTTIQGIHFINDPSQFNPDGHEGISGVRYNDVEIPGERKDLKTHLEENFCQQPLNETYVPRLKCAIQNHYADAGHPLVMVCIPPQNVTCGCVQVLVQEATLGQIRTEGNCWFSDRLLKSYIKICPGDPICEDTLLNDVAWMNRNPFRFTQVSFTPGCEPCTTDIELITVERRPFRFYTGVDNAGSDQTSQTRLFAGFTAGNLWDLDHIFGYQYTTSPNFHRFQSHTLNYQAPLPWQDLLMFYGGYAEVHPKLRDFHSHGRSYQASARYTMPFKPLYGDTLNELRFGFDFKSTNNNLQFTDSAKTSIITGTVNLSQFMVGYNYGGDYGPHELLGSIQIYGSPGQLFDRESKRDYENLRYKARPTYCYGQFTGGYNFDFSWGTEVSFLVRTQYSTTNLLPSEQFVIGGFDTVRGYKEFEVLTDNGLIVNVELRTPAWSLLGNCPSVCGWKFNDELRLLAFIDYGKGFNHRLFPDERRDYQLLSVGPGLRYKIADHLSVRLDWGIKLKKSSRMFGWGSKLHFGVIGDF